MHFRHLLLVCISDIICVLQSNATRNSTSNKIMLVAASQHLFCYNVFTMIDIIDYESTQEQAVKQVYHSMISI